MDGERIIQSIELLRRLVHWGDMDFGGFSMLARLRREINSEIQPFRMDLNELISHQALSVKTTADYALRLQKLAGRPELKDYQETLSFLAEHRLRLEQEALLLTDLGSDERIGKSTGDINHP